MSTAIGKTLERYISIALRTGGAKIDSLMWTELRTACEGLDDDIETLLDRTKPKGPVSIQGRAIDIRDPATWPKAGASGPAVAVLILDQAEAHCLSALGDFHCDDEFEAGVWPYDPDALARIREKLPYVAPRPPVAEPPAPMTPPPPSQLAPVTEDPEFAEVPERVGGMEHAVKSWPASFVDISTLRKGFDVRVNDRNYQVGDIMRLREFIPAPNFTGGNFTGRSCRRRITFVLAGEVARLQGIRPLHCVLGLEEVRE